MSAIRFRSFRNGDPPKLLALWNQGAPACNSARELTMAEWELSVTGQPLFDTRGLIVAEDEATGELLGFAHGGFGPPTPIGPPLRLDKAMGVVSMFVSGSAEEPPEWGPALIREVERYLRAEGAGALYAGGAFPLNPFYWGIYGGSEYSGIDPRHAAFDRTVIASGYQPCGESVLLEAEVARANFSRHAMAVKRTYRFELEEDAMPSTWWENLALSEWRLSHARLVDRDGRVGARASLWNMEAFGRVDHVFRLGIFDLWVEPDLRRKGLGSVLVSEIKRVARITDFDRVAAQTDANNAAALAFYRSAGFARVGSTRTYRLPGELTGRSDSKSDSD